MASSDVSVTARSAGDTEFSMRSRTSSEIAVSRAWASIPIALTRQPSLSCSIHPRSASDHSRFPWRSSRSSRPLERSSSRVSMFSTRRSRRDAPASAKRSSNSWATSPSTERSQRRSARTLCGWSPFLVVLAPSASAMLPVLSALAVLSVLAVLSMPPVLSAFSVLSEVPTPLTPSMFPVSPEFSVLRSSLLFKFVKS
ncbi:hypothetical protein SD72_13120 [Leucobacter komagatae]|uniref:Uncharacterized protein n=1 Tax=Leucobacter komagatae TaxID=55969 RepID=A0A0D0IL01_9MICO|nr:hypothetical protein SD72_13120 [Leucobacter komagatae]